MIWMSHYRILALSISIIYITSSKLYVFISSSVQLPTGSCSGEYNWESKTQPVGCCWREGGETHIAGDISKKTLVF